ncbi:DUF6088 family protein [Pseudomonas sp. Sample_23]|uniref:DUF6088 family protein n=1 Tax=Pseudomonas sp. Sample_23 TaxID=2448267 RepID=UPI0010329CB8|nr:DUF6088 family protein [Pseudomonas sp. Sample_23]
MSIAECISKRIKRMPKGRPFVRAVFQRTGSRSAVNKALSQMVFRGILERISRGVYMRPKYSQYSGKRVRANPISVLEAVARARGETIQIHGAEAVRRLGLSVQMQVLPTFYTSGATREIKVGNAVVRLRHASQQRLQRAGTRIGTALTAFFYLGKNGVNEEVASKIANSLNDEEFNKLMECKMPKWMRSALSNCARNSR